MWLVEHLLSCPECRRPNALLSSELCLRLFVEDPGFGVAPTSMVAPPSLEFTCTCCDRRAAVAVGDERHLRSLVLAGTPLLAIMCDVTDRGLQRALDVESEIASGLELLDSPGWEDRIPSWVP